MNKLFFFAHGSLAVVLKTVPLLRSVMCVGLKKFTLRCALYQWCYIVAQKFWSLYTKNAICNICMRNINYLIVSLLLIRKSILQKITGGKTANLKQKINFTTIFPQPALWWYSRFLVISEVRGGASMSDPQLRGGEEPTADYLW